MKGLVWSGCFQSVWRGSGADSEGQGGIWGIWVWGNQGRAAQQGSFVTVPNARMQVRCCTCCAHAKLRCRCPCKLPRAASPVFFCDTCALDERSGQTGLFCLHVQRQPPGRAEVCMWLVVGFLSCTVAMLFWQRRGVGIALPWSG